jgi:dihydropteroate synthase
MSAPRPVNEIAKRFRKPLIMGIINCTPDSFHEGSRANTYDAAVERALTLASEGADILDFGGQSTRPQSVAVSEDVERGRVIPVIRAVAKRLKVQISIDTDKAVIASEALDAGATILNDVSALRADKNMLQVALRADRVVLMHMLGTPQTMQNDPRYEDVFAEVQSFLQARHIWFGAPGARADKVWIDPGIGFGKTLNDNLILIKRSAELASIAPVLLGVSRKSFLGKILNDNGSGDRLSGSLAVAAFAAFNGVSVLRVHDVLETLRVINILAAVSEAA